MSVDFGVMAANREAMILCKSFLSQRRARRKLATAVRTALA
jgi:hypothetical protein